MADVQNPYGDGTAARQIADVIRRTQETYSPSWGNIRTLCQGNNGVVASINGPASP